MEQIIKEIFEELDTAYNNLIEDKHHNVIVSYGVVAGLIIVLSKFRDRKLLTKNQIKNLDNYAVTVTAHQATLAKLKDEWFN